MDKIVFNLQTGALFFQFTYLLVYGLVCMCMYHTLNKYDKEYETVQKSVYEICGQYMGLCFMPFLAPFYCISGDNRDFEEFGWFGRILISLVGIFHLLPGILILAGCSHLVFLFPGNTFGYSFYLSISSMLYYFLMVVFGTIWAYYAYTEEDKAHHFCMCLVGKDLARDKQNQHGKEKKPTRKTFFNFAKIMTTDNNQRQKS